METFNGYFNDFVRIQHEQGALGGAYGRSVEDERAFAVATGWESMAVSSAKVVIAITIDQRLRLSGEGSRV